MSGIDYADELKLAITVLEGEAYDNLPGREHLAWWLRQETHWLTTAKWCSDPRLPSVEFARALLRAGSAREEAA